jgi:hypothetical protein
MSESQPNSLPVEQIHQFWGQVEEQLGSNYSIHGDRAIRAILRYRNEIDRIGPIIYHRPPKDVADDIVHGEYVAAERKVG